MYTKEWVLTQKEYLSDIAGEIDVSTGVTLLIADVGTGKSTYFSQLDDVHFIAPLVSIVSSIEGKDVSTWNRKAAQVLHAQDKSIFKTQTLVIDECHGLYTDMDYKESVINDIMKMIPLFKSVVLMSGTTREEYLSSVEIDRVYRVRKPSKARKELHQHIVLNDMKKAVEQGILLSKGTKGIALINDIELCKRIQRQYGEKALVVSSEVKNDPKVQQFYKSKSMTFDGMIDGEYVKHDYDLIIGTDSIREGLSIEDSLEQVNVFIYQSRDPDSIEQFTNRFRNINDLKVVHYYTNDHTHIDAKPFDIEALKNDSDLFCKIVNYRFDSFETEIYKNIYRNNYGSDMKGSGIIYDKALEKYVVNSIFIDWQYYKHREKQYRNDMNLFTEVMSQEYNFVFAMPDVVQVNKDDAKELKADLKKAQEATKAEYVEVLKGLAEDFDTGDFRKSGESEDYDVVRESVNKLLKNGLRPEDVRKVIEGVIADKDFIKKVWSDNNYIEHDNAMRKFIQDYVSANNIRGEFDKATLEALVSQVVQKVLKDLFMRDVQIMAANVVWKQYVDNSNGTIVIKKGKSKEILQKYIRIDSQRRRMQGDKAMFYWIVDYTLSGVVLQKSVPLEVRSEPELLPMMDFKAKLAVLRTAA
ncbi:hypothetical protein CI789_12080 [Erwinia persicina]|uniref:hypothetical protein n=1 Tax=Erwinia persicina TaxID=55211 RepID=UPI000E4E89AE|nr:hypothetical protein [Erwinia persicina]AXU95907.1 hypothetical protein CI789_12080 [Erwinia persicina]